MGILFCTHSGPHRRLRAVWLMRRRRREDGGDGGGEDAITRAFRGRLCPSGGFDTCAEIRVKLVRNKDTSLVCRCQIKMISHDNGLYRHGQPKKDVYADIKKKRVWIKWENNFNTYKITKARLLCWNTKTIHVFSLKSFNLLFFLLLLFLVFCKHF